MICKLHQKDRQDRLTISDLEEGHLINGTKTKKRSGTNWWEIAQNRGKN